MAFDTKEYLIRLGQCENFKAMYKMPLNVRKDRDFVETYIKISDLWKRKSRKDLKANPVFYVWFDLIEKPNPTAEKIVNFIHDLLIKVENQDKIDTMAINHLFSIEEQNILATLVNKVKNDRQR